MILLTVEEENEIIMYISNLYTVFDEVHLMKFLQDNNLIKSTDEVINEILKDYGLSEEFPHEWLSIEDLINDSDDYVLVVDDKCLNISFLNDSSEDLIKQGILYDIEYEDTGERFSLIKNEFYDRLLYKKLNYGDVLEILNENIKSSRLKDSNDLLHRLYDLSYSCNISGFKHIAIELDKIINLLTPEDECRDVICSSKCSLCKSEVEGHGWMSHTCEATGNEIHSGDNCRISELNYIRTLKRIKPYLF